MREPMECSTLGGMKLDPLPLSEITRTGCTAPPSAIWNLASNWKYISPVSSQRTHLTKTKHINITHHSVHKRMGQLPRLFCFVIFITFGSVYHCFYTGFATLFRHFCHFWVRLPLYGSTSIGDLEFGVKLEIHFSGFLATDTPDQNKKHI